MTPLAFFRSERVLQLLDLAARAAGSPITLHKHVAGRETPRIVSTGSCEACRFVATVGKGRKACRRSRFAHAQQALRRRSPVPFICHMGFVCVSVAPLPVEEDPYVITIGPFCPSPTPVCNGPQLVRALARDAKTALRKLEQNEETGLRELELFDEDLPFAFDDVAVVPADVVPSIAEWLAASLCRLWLDVSETGEGLSSEGEPDEGAVGAGGAGRRGRTAVVKPDPYHAAEIAAAILGSDRARVRRLVRLVLEETNVRGPAGDPAQRARALALTGAVLEALVRAGVDVGAAWAEVAQWMEATREPATPEWPGRVARLLLTVTRPAKDKKQGLVERVDAMVAGRVAEPITLTDLAQALECSPSAVTHALQRKFGLSFTQYVGRLRVQQAKELLRRTPLPIGEIARRTGIHDPSNFNRLFKKFEGLTPAEYRKRIRAKT
jgi:AraC-like DNA-binding protein